MATDPRETLHARADVADEDIDDIIGIAAELQREERRAQEGRASLEEVEAVAEELDLEARFVEQAVAVLEARRAEVLRADLQAAERRTRLAMVSGTVAAALAALAVAVAVALGAAGRDLDVAATNVEHAASYLELVLDRQAALVPSLVALSGGSHAELEAAAQRLREAQGLDARLEASRALDAVLSAAVADLPPPRDDTEGVQRLGLQHELTGVQDRLATESRRLADARREWALMEQRPLGSWALQLGWGRAPET